MKVLNITDLEKFFEVIDQCEEKVELVTHNPADTGKIIHYMMNHE